MEGDVGILAGVFPDFFHFDVAHRALSLSLLADQLGDGHRFVAEVLGAEQIHGTLAFGLDDVVCDHGVENLTCQFVAVPAEYEHVVLEVLSHPSDVRTGEDGSHCRQDLPGGLRVGGAGDVPGFPRLPGEAQSYQLGVVGIEAGRFGIEADLPLEHEFSDKGVQGFRALDGMVFVRGVMDVLLGFPGRVCGVCFRPFGGRGSGLRIVDRLSEQVLLDGSGRGVLPVCFRDVEFLPEDSSAECPEFEFPEDGAQGLFVHVADAEVLFVELDGDVGDDGREFFRHEGQVAPLADFLAHGALDVVGVVEHVFEGVELGQQFGRRLLSYAGDAGDIVDGVAHEAEDVDDLVDAPDIPFGAYLLRTEDFEVAALVGGLVDADPVGDELSVVLVGGNHEDFVAGLLGLFGEGAYDIVRLIPVGLDDGDVETLDDAFDVGDG